MAALTYYGGMVGLPTGGLHTGLANKHRLPQILWGEEPPRSSPEASGLKPSTQTSIRLVMQVSTSCKDWVRIVGQTYAPHNAELRNSWWHGDILHSLLYFGIILRVPKPTSASTLQGQLASRQGKDRKMLKPCTSSRQDPAKSSWPWQPGTDKVNSTH